MNKPVTPVSYANAQRLCEVNQMQNTEPIMSVLDVGDRSSGEWMPQLVMRDAVFVLSRKIEN